MRPLVRCSCPAASPCRPPTFAHPCARPPGRPPSPSPLAHAPPAAAEAGRLPGGAAGPPPAGAAAAAAESAARRRQPGAAGAAPARSSARAWAASGRPPKPTAASTAAGAQPQTRLSLPCEGGGEGGGGRDQGGRVRRAGVREGRLQRSCTKRNKAAAGRTDGASLQPHTGARVTQTAQRVHWPWSIPQAHHTRYDSSDGCSAGRQAEQDGSRAECHCTASDANSQDSNSIHDQTELSAAATVAEAAAAVATAEAASQEKRGSVWDL